MTMPERIAVVEACRHVDQVIADAPLTPNEMFLDSIGAAKLVHGDDFSREQIAYFYGDLQKSDRLILVRYTAGIATTDIIQRIAGRRAGDRHW